VFLAIIKVFASPFSPAIFSIIAIGSHIRHDGENDFESFDPGFLKDCS